MTKPSPEDLEFEEIRAEIPLRHKLFKEKKFYLFIFGCAGSSLLQAGAPL